MRQTLGLAVFAGMLGVTIFGIFLTPVFYYVIQKLSKRKKAAEPDDASSHAPHHGDAVLVGAGAE
jgi:hypothetical protein